MNLRWILSQPTLRARHDSVIAVVIVSQQVQQSVQREDSELRPLGMSSRAGLPPCDTPSDDDISKALRRIATLGLARSAKAPERTLGRIRKTQHIRCGIAAPISTIPAMAPPTTTAVINEWRIFMDVPPNVGGP